MEKYREHTEQYKRGFLWVLFVFLKIPLCPL
jgi:hypothetical protein